MAQKSSHKKKLAPINVQTNIELHPLGLVPFDEGKPIALVTYQVDFVLCVVNERYYNVGIKQTRGKHCPEKHCGALLSIDCRHFQRIFH